MANNVKLQAFAEYLVMPGDNLQAAFDKGGLVVLLPGEYGPDEINIEKDVTVYSTPTTLLQIPGGIRVNQSSAVYPRVLNWYGGGALFGANDAGIGLDLLQTSAHIFGLSVHGFNIGMKVYSGIRSSYQDCTFEGATNGLYVPWHHTTTTQMFQSCAFRMASLDAAARIDRVSDVVLDACVFESARNGLVVNDSETVTVRAPYFENITRTHIAIGETGSAVKSVTIENPRIYHDNDQADGYPILALGAVDLLTWRAGNIWFTRTTPITTTVSTGTVLIDPPPVYAGTFEI